MATIAAGGGRESVLDDHDSIRLAMVEIRDRETLCDTTRKTVYDCLRMGSSCVSDCPHKARWVGGALDVAG